MPKVGLAAQNLHKANIAGDQETNCEALFPMKKVFSKGKGKAGLKAIPQKIRIRFPEKDDWVQVVPRTDDDLPKELKGGARWTSGAGREGEEHYEATNILGAPTPVEYLNHEWFELAITEGEDGVDYWTKNSFMVNKRKSYGLGTEDILSDDPGSAEGKPLLLSAIEEP